MLGKNGKKVSLTGSEAQNVRETLWRYMTGNLTQEEHKIREKNQLALEKLKKKFTITWKEPFLGMEFVVKEKQMLNSKQDMKKLTIDDLRKNGWIAYEYVRGSHAYGTNVATSDEDHGGVFICPKEYLYGLRENYIEQVADEKGDTVFYEFGRWIELLLKANPTALESLYIPERCIVGHVHPAVRQIIEHRDMFLSKECFKTLTGYATSQIMKARGLNKKIVNPIHERKGVLDFCYVPWKQGSISVSKWLENHGLKQKYCGLVALPNMHNTYGLYYDWGTHLICEYGADLKERTNIALVQKQVCNDKKFHDTFCGTFGNKSAYGLINTILPYGFTGIVNENTDSNEVRVCTVPKEISPLAIMTYNKSGYESHCRDYAEYKTWEKNRNPARYESNLKENYDSKNMMHCMRLTIMGRELAEGKGLNVDRTGIDKDFLLDIRNHKYQYDEIIAMAEKEKVEMENAAKTSTLPDKVDVDKINDLLIDAREKIIISQTVSKY